ncbi:hypothetical protein BDW02DRAFT_57023 [Decorospora gaudefroyi]|uniref:Uncharacterized protein n=1 Tax=Decorospora gaudefroyi TaxID=184978 RepID=A0A6A5K8N9_9PLEO|nr:hypothetical protein BDW02DRAFT_57023 [Decorospora gaudefroyi]
MSAAAAGLALVPNPVFGYYHYIGFSSCSFKIGLQAMVSSSTEYGAAISPRSRYLHTPLLIVLKGVSLILFTLQDRSHISMPMSWWEGP